MESLDLSAAQILAFAVSLTRLATAFIVIPALAPETVPPLVRNSLFVSLGLVLLAVQPDTLALRPDTLGWIALFAREAFIGAVIGLFFSLFILALRAAGQIVDAQIGRTIANIIDPLNGEQVSLTGEFLVRFANVVFIAGGGFMIMIGVVLESFAVLPLAASPEGLVPRTGGVFEAAFGLFMTHAVIYAAPIVCLLFLTDFVLGLVNRFAQQLNAFALSLPIKAVLSVAILILMTPGIATAVVEETRAAEAELRILLPKLFSTGSE